VVVHFEVPISFILNCMTKFAIIIAAAGSGTRFQSGNQKKTYALIGGKPIWQHSVERFANREDVNQILIVVSPDDIDWFSKTHSELLGEHEVQVIAGGSERFQSVENAIEHVAADSDFIAVHDAARPCLSDALLERIFATAREHGNAVPAVPVSSTLKRSSNGIRVEETVDRSSLYQSQTPQVFRAADLKSAFQNRGDLEPTDEAQLMELLEQPVHLAEGCVLNRKITSQADMRFAEAAMSVLDRSNVEPIHFDGPTDDSIIR